MVINQEAFIFIMYLSQFQKNSDFNCKQYYVECFDLYNFEGYISNKNVSFISF